MMAISKLWPKLGHQYTQIIQGTNHQATHDDDIVKTGQSRKSPVLCVLVASLCCIILGLSVEIAFAAGKYSTVTFQPSLLPTVESITPVTFEADYTYWNFSNYESEQAWRTLGMRGHIMVYNPSQFGLAPGIETDGGSDALAVSAFHQLHCLKILRNNYAALVRGEAIPDEKAHHDEHCFDYLRQAIMCASDLTLEGARVDADGHRRATDGWGSVHRCRDWEEVQNIVDEYRWKYSNAST